MTEAKWDAVSPEDQAKITELSGVAFARLVGEAWNGADATGAQVAADGKLQVEDAGAEVVAAIRACAGELKGAWADSLDAGYDGRAALAEFRKMTGIAQ